MKPGRTTSGGAAPGAEAPPAGSSADASARSRRRLSLRPIAAALAPLRDAVLLVEASPRHPERARVAFANDAFVELASADHDSLRGRRLGDLFELGEDQPATARLLAAFRLLEPVELELALRLPDGRVRRGAWAFHPIARNEAGSAGWMAIRSAQAMRAEAYKLASDLQREVADALARHDGSYAGALRAAMEQLARASGWDYAEAWLVTRDRTGLKPGPTWCGQEGAFQPLQSARRRLGFRKGVGLPGQAFASGHPEWVEDLDAGAVDGFVRAERARECGVRSVCAVPCIADGRVEVVFAFFAIERVPRATPGTEAMIGALRNLGPLLARVRHEGELATRMQQQAAVARLGIRALTDLTDLHALFRHAAELVTRTLAVEFCQIAEPDGASGGIRLRAGAGWRYPVDGMVLPGPATASHGAQVLARGEPVLVEDFRRETDFQASPLLREHDAVSGLGVIIPGPVRPLGAVSAYSRRRQRFSDDDIDFLQAVANVLGGAFEQARARAAIAEREARIAAMVKTAVDGILTLRGEGSIESVNPAAERLFGYAAHEMVDLPVGRLVARVADGRDPGPDFAELLADVAAGSGEGRETLGRRQDGSTFPMYLSLGLMGSGGDRRYVAIVHDTSHLREIERHLREERAFVSAVLDTARALVMVIDTEGRVVRMNRACEEATGLSRVTIARSPVWSALADAGERGAWIDLCARWRREGPPPGHESDWTCADGTVRRLAWSFSEMDEDEGKTRYLIATGLDVTARHRLEAELARHRRYLEKLVVERTEALEATHEQLRQSERMAALGTLVGGLGHDMKNTLLPAFCALETLERGSGGEDADGALQTVRRALEYLRQLGGDLRLFAHDPEEIEPAGALDARLWWRDAEPLLRAALPKTVELDVAFDPALPLARVRGHRLTQAVLNLLSNASEAMRGQGRIGVAIAPSPDRGTVRIVVEDEGPGMSEEVRRHAIEPFFTTKTRGLSTGLGLSLVHGIVRGASGALRLGPRPGGGTRVVLEFPAEEPHRTDAPRGLRTPGRGPRASVRLADPRSAAFVERALRARGFVIAESDSVLRVRDADRCEEDEMRDWLAAAPDRRVLLLGPERGDSGGRPGGVLRAAGLRDLDELRTRLDEASCAIRGETREEFHDDDHR